MSRYPRPGKRYSKPLLVLAVEGRDNKTERSYFEHYRVPECPYAIQVQPCHHTDPEGMLSEGLAAFGDEENPKSRLFIVTDSDVSKEKLDIIRKLQKAQPPNVRFIVSEPCFEIWFLLHYEKKLSGIHISDDAIKRLKKHLPNYEKNRNVFSLDQDFENHVDAAMKNSKQALAKRKNVIEAGFPATMVHQIVELLVKKTK